MRGAVPITISAFLRRQRYLAGSALIVVASLFAFPAVTQAVVNTSIYPATKDAWIAQDTQIRNYGTDNRLEIMSRSGTPDRNRRSLLAFDVSSIPAGAAVEDATLRLWLQTAPAAQRTYNVYSLTSPWLEGTGNGANNSPAVNGVTWIERQFGNNLWTGAGPWDWVAGGGDFSGLTAATPTPNGSGEMNWDVAGDVGVWVSGAGVNHGWLIADSNENSGNSQRGRFGSRENGNAAQRPVLTVTYLRAAVTVSTTTVETGWRGELRIRYTNNGGPGADQIHQVSVGIPAGFSGISTSSVGYGVSAPAGKTWAVTGLPTGPDGTQTVTLTAATPADDLGDGQAVETTFTVTAPWLSGQAPVSLSVVGAAGGIYRSSDWMIDITPGSLDFTPGADTSLAALVLSGADETSTGTIGPLVVRDARGAGAGWSLVIASTDFVHVSGPAQAISASGFVVPSSPPVTVFSGASPPMAGAGSLAGPGLAIMNAPAGIGMGHYQVAPILALSVPAATLSGAYEATVTQTLIGL